MAHVKNFIRGLASLRVAIPLLVVVTAVTVAGSLFPKPELFRSPWYLGLLGALGLSLLLVTITHIPSIRRRKGRKALIGVITTHAGILVLIAAAIHAELYAERWNFRAIEGEVTVVPGMPWLVELVAMEVEAYDPSQFIVKDPASLPNKRQDSHFRLYREGNMVADVTVAPGRPARLEGFTLLPAIKDLGWVFELIVDDHLGRERTMLFKPWAPSVGIAGDTEFMAHLNPNSEEQSVQIFTMVEGRPQLLGEMKIGQGLTIGGVEARFASARRYTGVVLYNRPHMPLLVAGSLLMLAGLLWHFYYRYRD